MTRATKKVNDRHGRRTSNAMALGEMVRALRERRGLAQATDASAAKTRADQLIRLEDGQIPSPGLATLTRIAHTLASKRTPDSDATERQLGLLAAVFAGETTAEAVCLACRAGQRTRLAR
jgi:transcriptional regulator with XRE-family HTH domain